MDKVNNPVQTVRGIVGIFGRKSGNKAEIGNAECYCLKDRGKVVIERTIDENRAIKGNRQAQPFGGCGSEP